MWGPSESEWKFIIGVVVGVPAIVALAVGALIGWWLL